MKHDILAHRASELRALFLQKPCGTGDKNFASTLSTEGKLKTPASFSRRSSASFVSFLSKHSPAATATYSNLVYTPHLQRKQAGALRMGADGARSLLFSAAKRSGALPTS
jgi:hypothetical protein